MKRAQRLEMVQNVVEDQERRRAEALAASERRVSEGEAKLAELPIGRFGRVDEVALTVVLLASDAGSYYVGATMNMNGGDYMV